MEDDARRVGVLRWRGVFAEETLAFRCGVAVMLALICMSSILMGWGYVGVQFADGSASYLMFMLIPVALASLFLGTWRGTAVGLFSGLVLYLHARMAPLDYFELVYVTPLTSIVLTAIFGFVLGALFSQALREGSTGWRRAALLMLACLVASCVFGVGFAVTVGWHAQASTQAIAVPITPGSVLFQVACNSVVLAAITLVALMLVERAGIRVNLAGLRSVFGLQLLAVVITASLVVGMVAYVRLTAGKLAGESKAMRGEAEYLLEQVQSAAKYDWKVSQLISSGKADLSEVTEKIAELDLGGMVASLIQGYTEDQDGLVIVLALDQVLGIDTDRLGVTPNDSITDCLGEDLLAAVQRSVENGSIEQVVYRAPSEYDGLFDLALPGTADAFASLETLQVGYLVAVKSDDITVVKICPASKVFEGRNAVVGWIYTASLCLLLVVSALVWRLLDQLVAQRIDATNGALARITEGNLEVRVEPEGTLEFQELSMGINHTVDVLQDWIAEAERRMDAEMTAAKAIQESALPRVFPPFPDIRCFDLFASMNAAKEVGGDFYDFFLVGDDCDANEGRLAFVMADVSGKGVPAALFMMKAKTQIRDYLESGMALGEAVENANLRLCEGNEEEDMFVTAWVGVLDYATGHIDFVNAGHNPPLLRHGGSWRWVSEVSGLPLGIFDDMPYETRSLDCEAGDQILLYTDGVTEAFSVAGELYGEQRLEELVNKCGSCHPHELVDCVRASVAAHAEGADQSDDITILALEVQVPAKKNV